MTLEARIWSGDSPQGEAVGCKPRQVFATVEDTDAYESREVVIRGRVCLMSYNRRLHTTQPYNTPGDAFEAAKVWCLMKDLPVPVYVEGNFIPRERPARTVKTKTGRR